MRSAGRCGGQREFRHGGFGGIKVRLWRAEKSEEETAAFSSPSKPEANFVSNEHFGLDGGGPRSKLGEDLAGGQKVNPNA